MIMKDWSAMLEFIMNGGLLIHDDTTRHIVETSVILFFVGLMMIPVLKEKK
jgi:hypothetical protein